MCAPMSRRQLLRYFALAAATPVLLERPWRPARAFAQVPSRAVPLNLELVTVTDTSCVLTWFTGDPASPDEYGRPRPVPADTVLELGTTPTSLQRIVDRNDETPYHYVEVTGLEPGRAYFFRATSNGIGAVPTVIPPSLTGGGSVDTTEAGTFTTLIPPAGDLLMTLCWANDMHIGEMTSGLAYSDSRLPSGGFPPGYAVDPDNPYWKFMAEAAVAESRERGAELMLVNGDLTSGAEPVDMQLARSIMDGFGRYRRDYFVTRGNHDRAHSGETWSTCEPDAANPEYNDCLRDYFFGDRPTYFSFDRKGVHFVGLDTNDVYTGTGQMETEQLEWLEADLAASSGRPTFVFGHHPISEEASATAAPPIVFTLDAEDARRVEATAAQHSVIGVYSAHTHRNKVTHSTATGDVPYIELGAVKEYPGGYGIVRLYEGGYMVNFYKTSADPARAWSERSRGEYLGLYPYYTLGTLRDRNFVVSADLSDAARRPRRNERTRAAETAEGAALPATGGSGTHAATAAGLVAAGLAAAAAARRVR